MCSVVNAAVFQPRIQDLWSRGESNSNCRTAYIAMRPRTRVAGLMSETVSDTSAAYGDLRYQDHRSPFGLPYAASALCVCFWFNNSRTAHFCSSFRGLGPHPLVNHFAMSADTGFHSQSQDPEFRVSPNSSPCLSESKSETSSFDQEPRPKTPQVSHIDNDPY